MNRSNMKKSLILLLLILFSGVSFGQIKTFTKEATEIISSDKSQDQVIAYLTQKLTRQATEEAGMFITSELNIKNYQITKDEFTSFAGSISKVKVEDKETFTKDNQQYVKVKVNIEVDTDSIQPYLDKILQDNKYKKEAENLRKKNLELEERLKNATKQEYEQKLSLELQNQIELQKQRAIELNKMALQAKEEYTKVKEKITQQQIEREQEILKLKEQIAQEKDNIKKAELENQAKIKELELKAKENQNSWNTDSNKISIQQAIQEATKVKQETAEMIKRFETLLKENKDKITKGYDEQIKLSCDDSKRGQWETEEEYNVRKDKNKQIEDKLNKEKKEILFEDEKKATESMVPILNPFIEKLQHFQTEKFHDKDGSKAELISIEQINVDGQYFVINIRYKKRKYKLNYDFSKVGKEQAKLMYQTQNQFVIEPLFSVSNKLEQKLTAFNIKHLGTKEEKILYVSTKITPFDEVKQYNKFCDNNKFKIFDLLNEQIRQFKNEDKLKYFTEIIKNLEKLKQLLFVSSDKTVLYDIEKYIDNLNDLCIAVAKTGPIIAGLKRNGVACFFSYTTTHSYHRKFDGSYTYSDGIRLDEKGEVADIVAICVYNREGVWSDVDDNIPICINKKGEFVTDYKYQYFIIKYKKKFGSKDMTFRWAKDVTSSYGADLKKDGTVFIKGHKVEELSIKMPEKLEKYFKD